MERKKVYEKDNQEKLIAVVLIITLIFSSSTMAMAELLNEECYIDLSEELQNKIDNLLEAHPQAKNYIFEVIENFSEVYSGKELEDYITEAIDSVEKCSEASEKNYAKIMNNKSYNIQQLSDESYQQALVLFALGVDIVRAANCPHTAEYMVHSVVEPGGSAGVTVMEHYNDEWAIQVCTSPTLNAEVTKLFESQILMAGKESGTVYGSADFSIAADGLDIVAALNRVNFSATFVKLDNGYRASYYVQDIYDFEYEKDVYNNFALNFANNYCAYMMNRELMKPFYIYILYSGR